MGFSISVVLNIICDPERWESAQKGRSGGARWYIDPVFGEQSFLYQYQDNKLHIDFCIAETFCKCVDIVTCSCDDEAQDLFSSWEEYWSTMHEHIELTKKQAIETMRPNLFSIIN